MNNIAEDEFGLNRSQIEVDVPFGTNLLTLVPEKALENYITNDIYIYTYIYIHMYMYVCIYIYISHTYVHIYIYIYI